MTILVPAPGEAALNPNPVGSRDHGGDEGGGGGRGKKKRQRERERERSGAMCKFFFPFRHFWTTFFSTEEIFVV
jgi:hypothetical protein